MWNNYVCFVIKMCGGITFNDTYTKINWLKHNIGWNQRKLDCFFVQQLFAKCSILALCEGNPPETVVIPPQKASDDSYPWNDVTITAKMQLKTAMTWSIPFYSPIGSAPPPPHHHLHAPPPPPPPATPPPPPPKKKKDKKRKKLLWC